MSKHRIADIAGKGIANPIGQIRSGAMMLEHIGYTEAAPAVVAATVTVSRESDVKTPDMGGTATAVEFGRVAEAVSPGERVRIAGRALCYLEGMIMLRCPLSSSPFNGN